MTISKLPTLQLGKIPTSKTPLQLMWGLRCSRPKQMAFELSRPQQVLMDNMLVFYPIYIYLLNEKKEVIEIKDNFRPFRFYRTRTKPKYIIESPTPLLAVLGQKIVWE